ncbi:phosphotransferase [bacterium]|nr:phosphotransferase [bacterium]
MQDRQKEYSGYGSVRNGFELDSQALETYMLKNIPGFEGPIEVKQFKGGQSNPTYFISSANNRYVLRKKPMGKLLKSAHAVDREYTIISALSQTEVPVAKVYTLCTDESIIGSYFYIMEYVEGRIFWSYNQIPYLDRKEIFNSMNGTIAALHDVDYGSIGLSNYGKAGNYFGRQVSRWKKQYEASKDKSYPVMEKLIEWLEQNIPDNDETTIVHGDFRLDNMIFHPRENRVIAVIDWELSTLGHPLSDFSYLCIIWRFPDGIMNGFAGVDCQAEGLPTEDEFMDLYCRKTGRKSIENWNYYMAFNIFRLAAIIFGIKGRIQEGTAASKQAVETAKLAVPLSELGWQQTGLSS